MSLSTLWQGVLGQGLSGYHVLFEPGMVRFAMSRAFAEDVATSETTRIVAVLRALDAAGDVSERRDWIAGAPLAVQELLVHAYFASLYAYQDERKPLAN